MEVIFPPTKDTEVEIAERFRSIMSTCQGSKGRERDFVAIVPMKDRPFCYPIRALQELISVQRISNRSFSIPGKADVTLSEDMAARVLAYDAKSRQDVVIDMCTANFIADTLRRIRESTQAGESS